MVDRYGRWMAALIMIGLLLAVVILFATIDLDLNSHTLTDVRSAPILASDEPTAATVSPLPSPEATRTLTLPATE